MGEPPRLLELLLPWEKSIIYFVTLCLQGRPQVLANVKVFEAIKSTIGLLRRWNVLAGVVMPDHVHFIVSPKEDRAVSVGDLAAGFKRLLREDENLHNKWLYVQENPVRKGFVEKWEDWPFYLDIIDEKGSYQLPLQGEPR